MHSRMHVCIPTKLRAYAYLAMRNRRLIPVLARLAAVADRNTVKNACWGLAYVTYLDSPIIAAVLKTGVLPRLVRLLGCNFLDIRTAALRSLGNISSGA